ncbi:hypothetical protein NGRA_2939 [Nosema granulosis]|uniref:Uncharacterized protein n=1 Tax=Nosema granulosis TaxID=83296 RepID=A0A9P6GVN2_9MICR|nr:hypothetical protein NGRA_2939 [Nosema granulosis]
MAYLSSDLSADDILEILNNIDNNVAESGTLETQNDFEYNEELLHILNNIDNNVAESGTIETQNDFEYNEELLHILNNIDNNVAESGIIETQNDFEYNEELLHILNNIDNNVAESGTLETQSPTLDDKKIDTTSIEPFLFDLYEGISELEPNPTSLRKRKIEKETLQYKRQKQDDKEEKIKVSGFVTKDYRAYQKCKDVFDAIYTIFKSIEKVFGITFSIKKVPNKVSNPKEAEYIFFNFKYASFQLQNSLKKNCFLVSSFPEKFFDYLVSTAKKISISLHEHDFVEKQWNSIANFKYKEVFNDVELKDLIILLLYQMEQTNHQFKEVKSVLLESFFVSKDIEKTKSLLIKTILLMIAGNLSNNNNPQKKDIDKINNFITNILVQYYWEKNTTSDIYFIYTTIKDRLEGLKIEEQALVPLKKDNLFFHISILKSLKRIFENFVYPLLMYKESISEYKISLSYYTLIKSLFLINTIADVFTSTRQLIVLNNTI